MKAYVTSIGESTTELCRWSLERQGFDVLVLNDGSTLWEKLNWIFHDAKDDFLRIDADVVVNANIQELIKQKKLWWYQAYCFGWFKQDLVHGGIQFIREECFPAILKHIKECERMDRPESYLSRLKEFHDPRVFGTFETICGIHGYGQFPDDIDRVKAVKMRRNRYGDYDWGLAERLDLL